MTLFSRLILFVSLLASPAAADFRTVDGMYGKMASDLYRGRFYEVRRDFSDEREKQFWELSLKVFLAAYHEVYDSACGVGDDGAQANTRIVKMFDPSVVLEDLNEFKVRREFARDFQDAYNQSAGAPFDMFANFSRRALTIESETKSAATKLISLNGCGSEELRVMELNLSRAFRDQRSLQEAGLVETEFMKACSRTDVAGMDDQFGRPVEETCGCLEDVAERALEDPRDLAVLEDNFDSFHLLGVLSTSSESWSQGRSCAGGTISTPASGPVRLTEQSSQREVVDELVRIGCLDDVESGKSELKRRVAVRCLQRAASLERTGKMGEPEYAALTELPDGVATGEQERTRTTAELSDPPSLPFLDGWHFPTGSYSGDAVIKGVGGYGNSQSELPGVASSVDESLAEFPELGIRVKEHWPYNPPWLEITAVQEFGPAWVWGYDEVVPGTTFEGSIDRLAYSVEQARARGGEVVMNWVSIENGSPRPLPPGQGRSIVKIGHPQSGSWYQTAVTPLERAASHPEAQARLQTYEAFRKEIDDWIEQGGCAITDTPLERLDAEIAVGSLAVGQPARIGDYLGALQAHRDRVCSRPMLNESTPMQVRYHTILNGDCDLRTPEGEARIEEHIRNHPGQTGGIAPIILTQMRKNTGALSPRHQCITEALKDDFFGK